MPRSNSRYTSGNTRYVGADGVQQKEPWLPTIGDDAREARAVQQAAEDSPPTAHSDVHAIDTQNWTTMQIQLIGSVAPVTATSCRLRIYSGDGVACPGLFDTIAVTLDPAFPNPQGRVLDDLFVSTSAEVVLVLDTLVPATAEVIVNTVLQGE